MKGRQFLLNMAIVLAAIYGLFSIYEKRTASPRREETPSPHVSFVQEESKPAAEPYTLPRIGPGKDTESVSPRPDAQEGQASLFESGGASSAGAPEADTAAIQEELGYLSANRPAMLIDCPRCEGRGEVQMDCAACGGLGTVPIPGVTAFTANVPCSECQGRGLQRCPDCTFGMVANPRYEEQQAAWTARRHELWGQLGYTEEEIRVMEMETAAAYLESAGDDDFQGGGYDGGTGEMEIPPELCRICLGSGDCATCGGDGYYQNPLTGNQLSCPNCRYTQGHCWSCGGSGRKD